MLVNRRLARPRARRCLRSTWSTRAPFSFSHFYTDRCVFGPALFLSLFLSSPSLFHRPSSSLSLFLSPVCPRLLLARALRTPFYRSFKSLMHAQLSQLKGLCAPEWGRRVMCASRISYASLSDIFTAFAGLLSFEAATASGAVFVLIPGFLLSPLIERGARRAKGRDYSFTIGGDHLLANRIKLFWSENSVGLVKTPLPKCHFKIYRVFEFSRSIPSLFYFHCFREK